VTASEVKAISVGDYVETQPFGLRGRVYAAHEQCPENMDWFRAQKYGLQRQDYWGPWLSVLVDGDGSIAVPLRNARQVPPFRLHNSSAMSVFGEEGPNP
jgi:hypothetical protein